MLFDRSVRPLHRFRHVSALAVLLTTACQEPSAVTVTEEDSAQPGLAIASNTWQQRQRMPSDRRAVITATVDLPGGASYLYAIGGQSVNATNWCSGSVSKVQAYDGSSNTWTTKASIPVPTHDGLAATVGNRVYVLGGCRMSPQAWQYDVSANQWQEKARAPMSLPGPVGSALGGKIYVYDSCGTDDCLQDYSYPHSARESWTFFGFYDTATDRWVRRPLPPVDFGARLGATFNGKLYFLSTSGPVWIHDPVAGTWTSRSGPVLTSGRPTAAVVKGKWYVVDGTVLRVYTPGTNTWAERAAPPKDYVSYRNGPSAGRVWANGVARLELVGGIRPNNNWQYTP